MGTAPLFWSIFSRKGRPVGKYNNLHPIFCPVRKLRQFLYALSKTTWDCRSLEFTEYHSDVGKSILVRSAVQSWRSVKDMPELVDWNMRNQGLQDIVSWRNTWLSLIRPVSCQLQLGLGRDLFLNQLTLLGSPLTLTKILVTSSVHAGSPCVS